jgi:aminopeptidase
MCFLAKLNEAAKVAMRDVLGLREGEEVLIITNFEGEVFPIAKALYEETKALGGRPVMLVQGTKTIYDHAERLVYEAIKAEPDIYVSMTANKLGKDAYGMNIGYVGRDGKKYRSVVDKLMDGDKRLRGFWSPAANVAMFERCVAVNYDEMQENAARLKKVLDTGKEVHVTSPAGTNVTISVEGRKAMADDGNFRLPGQGGNLPAGETFVSPVVGSTKGVIVFDGTIDLPTEAIIPKTPVKVAFKNGYVVKITGGKEATALLNVILKGEEMAREKCLVDEERNARHLGDRHQLPGEDDRQPAGRREAGKDRALRHRQQLRLRCRSADTPGLSRPEAFHVGGRQADHEKR